MPKKKDKNELTSADFKAELAEDKVYKRIMNNVDGLDDKAEAWIEEVMSLQVRRGIRSLNSTKLLTASQKIGIDSNLDNQAVRSRATEIKMRCMQRLLVVEESASKLKKYIAAQYSGTLSEMHRSVTERRAEIDHQLSKLVTIQERLSGVIKLTDVLIADLDAAGYTLHRIGSLLELKSKDR